MSDVSVIIPAHRQDPWLDEAVLSVLASDDVRAEVVVILNGVERVEPRSWIESEHVTVVHFRESLGPTRAMIRGLLESRSEFVGRLDADDRMHPHRLSAQIDYLRRNPDTSLVGTAVRRITASGAPAGSVRMPVGSDIRPHLVLSNTVTHSSVLMRREVLDAVGGYDPALSQMEDYDMILRLAMVGPVAVLADELTEYRLHAEQVSRGAAPHGVHIATVLARREQLGRLLGMSAWSIGVRNAVWRAAQYSRYWRLTKPGHEY